MQWTEEQQARVREWAAEGYGLSEIQTRLAEEFDLRLSYMDVRLMILELGVTIREKRAAPPKPQAPETPDAVDPEAGNGEGDADLDPPADHDGGVQVEVSRLAQPGFALNGDVTFSDGVKAQWGITARGELSLAAADPAYRPSAEDIQSFQLRLRDLLGGQGF